ncbi:MULTISPECIES: 2-oxoacid:acceptor oxidoreductase family protein [unclassified Adlercreutzia]|uniref:2-oxoacid:acceptor oxidoreductase family protein n=1 Tax=unclassified Adlercreutzia TaxID=2636013 RepID=UPI0013ED7F29|nr:MULTISPECIES: 2-oxoacid:acceptor oxidoreductase family protein [unclassified Adlercreutzia]
MSKDIQAVLAGFGGQGTLFAGKVIAYAGLIEDRYVSWFPSYGPEMRGGTANCSVTLSVEPIGSPLVTEPDAVIAMNQPSYDKFVEEASSGAAVVFDSDLVEPGDSRSDIQKIGIPAARIAQDAEMGKLANIVLLGKLWSITHFCERATLDEAIKKCVPPSKAHLVDMNKRALEMGIDA